MAGIAKLDSVRVASMMSLARALAALGGYATPHEAYRWIEQNTNLVDRMPTETKLPKAAHFEREVRFARQELADAGLLATVGNFWSLLAAATGELTSEDAQKIKRENTRQRRAGTTTVGSVHTESSLPLRNEKPSTGPKPVIWERLIRREIGPASVYVFRFVESSLWKIGFAADVEARLREVNRHVPVELLGRRWTFIRKQLWPSSNMAHHMEQRILEILKVERTVYERVHCSEAAIEAAWQQALNEVLNRTFQDETAISPA